MILVSWCVCLCVDAYMFVYVVCMHICVCVFSLASEFRSDQALHHALCSWLNDRDPIYWMQIRSIVSAPNSTQLLFL